MCKLLKVRGHSLAPEYQDGDFVLVSKIPVFFGWLRPGDGVAFRHPQYGLLIKKVAAILQDEVVEKSTLPQSAQRSRRRKIRANSYFVTGNHPLSVDSRQFGPIRRQAILGKVLAHIRKMGDPRMG